MALMRRRASYGLILALCGAAGIVGTTAGDVADATAAPTWVIVGAAVSSGVAGIAVAIATYLQIRRHERDAQEQAELQRDAKEREVVSALLTFLEDRRLLTDDAGYQSHFPGDLRASAEQIRQRTNTALQQVPRDSKLAAVLIKVQRAARDFQEATERATDSAYGGMTPSLPMGLSSFLTSLMHYREAMGHGMKEAAELVGVQLDQSFIRDFERGQGTLRMMIADFSNKTL